MFAQVRFMGFWQSPIEDVSVKHDWQIESVRGQWRMENRRNRVEKKRCPVPLRGI